MSSPNSNGRLERWGRWLPAPGSVIFTLLMIAVLVGVQSIGAFSLPALKSTSTTASGDSTKTYAYQGRLADTAGNPLTGIYPMVFRLYNAPGTGAYCLVHAKSSGRAA